MTDDIVTRLREEVAKAEVAGVLPNWELAKCMWEAADEIERLRAKLIDAYDDIGRCHAIIDQLRKDNPT